MSTAARPDPPPDPQGPAAGPCAARSGLGPPCVRALLGKPWICLWKMGRWRVLRPSVVSSDWHFPLPGPARAAAVPSPTPPVPGRRANRGDQHERPGARRILKMSEISFSHKLITVVAQPVSTLALSAALCDTIKNDLSSKSTSRNQRPTNRL